MSLLHALLEWSLLLCFSKVAFSLLFFSSVAPHLKTFQFFFSAVPTIQDSHLNKTVVLHHLHLFQLYFSLLHPKMFVFLLIITVFRQDIFHFINLFSSSTLFEASKVRFLIGHWYDYEWSISSANRTILILCSCGFSTQSGFLF